MSSTQVGKTFLLALWLFCFRLQHPSDVFPCWWLAPVFKQVRQGFRYIESFAKSCGLFGSKVDLPHPEIRIPGCGKIEFQSWKDPQTLLGTAVMAVVCDEAGLLTPAAAAVIRSRRSATHGPQRNIGNPGKTSGPFRKFCALAEDPENAKTHGFHRWTWETMYRHLLANDKRKAARYKQEILDARKELVDYEFRRLFLAEFTSDDAAVFRNVQGVTRGHPVTRPASAQDKYVMAVDVGLSRDFCVLTAMNLRTKRVEFMSRLRGVEYHQVARLHRELQIRFNNAPILVESNFIGKVLIEEYKKTKVAWRGFTTTSESKMEMIHAAAVEIAEGRVELAEMPPVQSELQLFAYDRAPSGRYKFQAPDGGHDDCVISVCACIWFSLHYVDLDNYGWVR